MKPTVLGIDCYAGLPLLGFQRAGYQVVGTLENGAFGSQTFQMNFPQVTQRLYGNWGNEQEFQSVNVLFSAPPCALWSKASSWAKKGKNDQRYKDDSRFTWHQRLSEVGRMIHPQVFIFESVIEMWRHGQDHLHKQAQLWEQEGYSVSIILHRTCFLSAPQNRERMLFIAHTTALNFPSLTHARTLKEILANVEPGAKVFFHKGLIPLWEQAYAYGGYLRRAMHAMGDSYASVKPGVMCRRLKWDDIPGVIMDDYNRLHPDEARYFTESEMKALSGVGQDWKSKQKVAIMVKELGESVLPDVTQWIGKALKKGLTSVLPPQPAMVYDLRELYNCQIYPYTSDIRNTFARSTQKVKI